MSDFSKEVAALQRGLRDRHGWAEAAISSLRERSVSRMEEVEKLEKSGPAPDDGGETVPPHVMREYRAVQEKIAANEYTWLDVLSGKLDDPDARVVHKWLRKELGDG